MSGENGRRSPGMDFEEFLSGKVEGVEPADLEGLKSIFREYGARVYSQCLRTTGKQARAQGLMKEAFLHSFRRLDTFRGVSNFYRLYARRTRAADFVADWICRQSERYRQAQSGIVLPGLPSPATEAERSW